MPVSLVVPAWTVSVPMDIAPAPASQALAVPPEATVESPGTAVETPYRGAIDSLWTSRSLLLWIWIAGCVAGALQLIVGGVRLAHLTRHAVRVSAGDWTRQARGSRRTPLASGGPWPCCSPARGTRWPRGASGARRSCCPRMRWPGRPRARGSCSCHELAHIARGDWPIQITADLLRTLLWFTPFTWILSLATAPRERAGVRRPRPRPGRARPHLRRTAGRHRLHPSSGAGTRQRPVHCPPFRTRRKDHRHVEPDSRSTAALPAFAPRTRRRPARGDRSSGGAARCRAGRPAQPQRSAVRSDRRRAAGRLDRAGTGAGRHSQRSDGWLRPRFVRRGPSRRLHPRSQRRRLQAAPHRIHARAPARTGSAPSRCRWAI